MMKTKFVFLTLFSLGFAVSLIAQPIIDFSNAPQVGSSITVAICSDQPSVVAINAEGGANQIWNYSTLTEVEQRLQQCLDPSTTPWSSRYPLANQCTAIVDSIYEYYHLSQDSLSIVGAVQIHPNDTLFLDYQNPELQYALPSSFGDQENDIGSGNFIVPFEIMADIEVDGFGTLILPNATFQSVVRIHSHSVFEPNVGEGSVTDRWTWFSSNHEGPLLTVLNLQGALQVVNMKVWYNKTPQIETGITNVSTASVEVFPNPTSVSATIKFSKSVEAGSRLIATDLQGKEVYRAEIESTQVNIHKTGVGKGVFLLYHESESSRTFLSVLVIN